MTTTAPAAAHPGPSLEPRSRETDALMDLSFAAVLQAGRVGLPGGADTKMAEASCETLLRFDETSVFGRHHSEENSSMHEGGPRLDTSLQEIQAPIVSTNAISPQGHGFHHLTQPSAECVQVTGPKPAFAELGARARIQPIPIAHTPIGAAYAPKTAPELSVAPQTRCPPLRRPAQQMSAIIVALHATEGELLVYARAGRMAPTERERLRNAIGALLCEYGLFGAAVKLDENQGAHHG
jgi:hypothetical protein